MPITPEMIIAERKRRKLSRAKFAELTGLRPGSITNIERGGRAIKAAELEVLEKFVPDEDGEAMDAAQQSGLLEMAVPLLNEDTDIEDFDMPLVAFPSMRNESATGALVDEESKWRHQFSNSELRTFKRCRRKWYLSHFRQLSPREVSVTGARELGTQIHKSLEAWYAPDGSPHTDPREALERVLVEDWTSLTASANPETGPNPEAVKQYKDQCDLARAIISGYVEWLAETGVDEDLEVIAPETKLTAEILPDIALIGKLDVEVRRRSDRTRLFIDHKSVGNLTTPLRTLHLDEQMLTYMLLQKLNTPDGELSAGALYNMLRKVKRTARAKPPFYERIEIQHNQHEIDSFHVRLVGTITVILDVIQQLLDGADHRAVAYPTPTSDCSWDCDFLAICSMMDDGSRVEDFISENYVQVDPLARYGTDKDKE